MKKSVTRIFIVFIIFFISGFILQWSSLTKQYQKCMNKEYSTYEDSEGKDLNEWMLEIHDNYSTTYKAEASFYGGLLWGTLGTIVFLYIYLLYKLFSSKNKKKMNIGYILITVAFVFLFLLHLFISNFKITF